MENLGWGLQMTVVGMGLVFLLLALLWVYDSSPGRERTRGILDRALNLLRMTLPLTRIPVVRAPLRELLALAGAIRA